LLLKKFLHSETLSKKTTGSACGLSNQFAKLVVRAGIESPRGAGKHGPAGRRHRTLCFHSLRHSFNSRLANADVGMDTRKIMVGHSSDSMNDRYTHLEVEMQDKALEKLSRALSCSIMSLSVTKAGAGRPL
jgi:integrase